MTYSNFMMQQEDENREDLNRAAAFGNACRECLSVMHDTADHDEHRPEPLKSGEVRLELAGLFRNQLGETFRGYAISDGWQAEHNSEEQFIVWQYGNDAGAMGRFDYQDLRAYVTDERTEDIATGKCNQRDSISCIKQTINGVYCHEQGCPNS